LNTAIICIEMGWDYLTYRSQPTWFIKMVADIITNRNKNDNSKTTNIDRRAR